MLINTTVITTNQLLFVPVHLAENKEDVDGWSISIGNCFKFMCCPRPVKEDKTHLNIILEKITDQKEMIKEQRVTMKKQERAVSCYFFAV